MIWATYNGWMQFSLPERFLFWFTRLISQGSTVGFEPAVARAALPWTGLPETGPIDRFQ